jgi:hypothetical protein
MMEAVLCVELVFGFLSTICNARLWLTTRTEYDMADDGEEYTVVTTTETVVTTYGLTRPPPPYARPPDYYHFAYSAAGQPEPATPGASTSQVNIGGYDESQLPAGPVYGDTVYDLGRPL